MKRTYYLFNPGRLSRKDQTLCFVPTDSEGIEQPAKYLPVETIETLYVFGSLDVNSALLNFMGKEQISLHFFDYYEHYTGSFMPKDYLLAGKVQVDQTKKYIDETQRIKLARKFVEGAAFNILKNLKYYQHRDKDLNSFIQDIEALERDIPIQSGIPELMGLEGNIRKKYYDAFDVIIDDFALEGRVRNPPSNEINALISFGNMMCYTLCLDMIRHTQLNPTISFLHTPGARRYSLALDLAEIFKPILVDRTIFKLMNKKELQSKHFDINLNGCMLNPFGKKIFAQAWEERLQETIQHRSLKRSVSYKSLVRLECYKLIKYITEIEGEYKPFKAWW